MARTIWKYQVSLQDDITDDITIDLPTGAQILCVQMQRDVPYVWAMVDPEAPLESRSLRIYGTGEPVSAAPGRYIGSFQLLNGLYVYHLFEARE